MVVSHFNRRGKQRGNGQWSTAVLDRAKGRAREARTARSPAARRGGAPVDPEHWDVLGRSGGCWGSQWSGVRSLVVLERLGRGLYSRAHGPQWTRAPARLQARLEGALVPVIKPGRIADVFHVQLRGEEERGKLPDRARVRGRGVEAAGGQCACGGSHWTAEEEGDSTGGGCGRRGALGGARGELEAGGGSDWAMLQCMGAL